MSLLLNSVSPIFQLAYAQEVSPEPSVSQEPSQPPSDQPTAENTVEPTVSPEVTPTEDISPSPTEEPITPSPAPVNNLSPPDESSQTSTNDQPSQSEGNSTSLTPSPTVITPTPTEEQNPSEEGSLSALILDDVSFQKLELLNIDPQEVETSATLTTDKLDYFPDDVVIITGKDFKPDTTYTLIITSDDPPPVHFEDEVKSNEEGGFIYAYQLDGIERLNYKVEAKDNSQETVASVTFTDTDANIDVTKTAADSTIDQGTTASYTITVDTDASANGTTAQNVILTDQLPAGTWTLGGADAGSCSIDGSNLLTCNFGDMPQDQTKTITVSRGTTDFCGEITNSATVTATNSRNGNQISNSDNNNTITVENCIDVSVDKTADDASISAGSVAHYNIKVKNESDLASGSFTLTDNLPNGTSGLVWEEDGSSGFPTGTSCSIVGNVLTCTIDSLASGASKTIQVKADTDVSDCGVLDNTATITVLNDDNTANNTDSQSITLSCKNIQVTKTGNGPVNVGDTAQFTIVVSSVGGEAANDVVLNDILPPGTWAVNYTGGSACDQSATGSFTCTNIDLGVSGSRTYTVTRTSIADDCPSLTNNVSVSVTGEEGPTDDNSANATIDINGCAAPMGSVTVNKEVDTDGDEEFEGGNGEANTLGFKWQLDLGSDNDMGSTVGPVSTGSHDVSETIPSGYHFVGWFYSENADSCEAADELEEFEDTSLPANINVNADETTDITLCNVRDTGTITVVKDVIDPDGNDVSDDHGFTVQLDGAGDQPLSESSNAIYSQVPSGEYTISELDDDEYDELGCKLEDESEATDFQVNDEDEITVTCTNQQKKATITVIKEVVDPNDNDVLDESTDFTFNVSTDSAQLTDEESQNFEVNPGDYFVEEEPDANYDFLGCEAVYDGDAVGVQEGNGVNVTVGSEDTVTVTCTNRQKAGKVIVTKYDDEDGDGELVGENPVLSGWTINLDDLSEVTGGNGTVEFPNLIPGTYTLGEDLQPGWEQTDISCPENRTSNNEDGTIELSLESGQELFCQILNHRGEPILTIAKTNNALTDKSPGDLVFYTITVTATQSAATDVNVTDLLPDGFTYQGGSWTANSDVRGDISGLGEPVYASPGVWTLGDMVENEIVTLTYYAKVSTGQEPGLYKDLAWGEGSAPSGSILALAEPEGYVDVNFVGTQVNIVKSETSSVDIAKAIRSEVLGTSTQLPATGINNFWALAAISLLLAGLSLVTTGYIIRKRYA